ncbi:neurotrophin-3-like isoform X4 [Biomphalaria glabrata]
MKSPISGRNRKSFSLSSNTHIELSTRYCINLCNLRRKMSSDLTKVNLFLTTALLVLVVDLCALDRRKRDTMSDEFLEYSRLQRRRPQHSTSPQKISQKDIFIHQIQSTQMNMTSEIDLSFDVESPVPACPSDVTWQRLSSARDLTGVTVTLVQHPTAQLFLIVRCKHHNCCLGIDNRRYNSSCRQEYGYTNALVYSPTSRNRRERRIIQFHGRCTCYVTPI